MKEPTVTLIVSDLHVGGGTADKGDDHIYQGGQFVRLLREQAATAEGEDGRLELFVNGDFLEFAQTDTEAFSLVSDRYWCTEGESLAKLETILTGHPGIFAALGDFMRAGNRVTIAAGNHDVDLWWPRVQARLRQATDEALRFELGQEWSERHGGQLQIAHGHMFDSANRFKHWAHPIRTIDWGVQRLEMCPGTLFMVKFVNKMEARYPFADNLLPITKLALVLMHDDRSGFAAMGWAFANFAGTSPLSVLENDPKADYGDRLLARVEADPDFRPRLASALAAAGQAEALARLQQAEAMTKALLSSLMIDLLGRIDDDAWRALFDVGSDPVLGNDDVTLVAAGKALFDDGKKSLRAAAQHRIDATGASVVVMGHTHQPDELELDGGTYYNPGSWTRYLELKPGQRVTLADLEDESRYPYQLNFVRVAAGGDGGLDSRMECLERG
jgi:UDP-2,3-diacylglucosamine pyrophosphatase LpxH